MIKSVVSLLYLLSLGSTAWSSELASGDRPGTAVAVFEHVAIDWSAPAVIIPVRISADRPAPLGSVLVGSDSSADSGAIMVTQARPGDLHRALILIGMRLAKPTQATSRNAAAPEDVLLIELLEPDSSRPRSLESLLGQAEQQIKWRFIGSGLTKTGKYQADISGVLIGTDSSSGAVIGMASGAEAVGNKAVNPGKDRGKIPGKSALLTIRPATPVPVVILMDRFGRAWLRYSPVGHDELLLELTALYKNNNQLRVRLIFDPLSIQSDRQELIDVMHRAGLGSVAIDTEFADRRYLLGPVTFPLNDPQAARQFLISKLARLGRQVHRGP